jgi:hypothetical protein
VVPIGLALGAGTIAWYFYMYGGSVEKKGAEKFVRDEAKIVEREHQASKVGVTRQVPERDADPQEQVTSME